MRLQPNASTYSILLGMQTDVQEALRIFSIIHKTDLKTLSVYNALLQAVGRCIVL